MQDLAPRLVAATREAPESIAGLCAALKDHVADSYRIHQRLIRSRRVDASGWEFMPRGPAVTAGPPSLGHVKTESGDEAQFQPLVATLEDWRFSAVEAAAGDGTALDRAASRYAEVLGAVSVGATALKGWLATAVDSFAGEADILEALRAAADDQDDDAQVQTMVESAIRLLRTIRSDTRNPKIVVFASSPDQATRFRDRFAALGDDVASHLLTEGDINNEKILAAFKAPRQDSILIVDRSGEEGLNLSLADAIVHLDLPLSAAEILEQRIGRLDRFGRRQAIIRHRILLPSDDETSPWAAWFELLANGFLIFNRSISDVQFLLATFEAQAFRTLLEVGPDGMADIATDVRARIDEERKSQDELYALDRIMTEEDPVETFIQALEDAEEDEDALEHGVDRWLVDALLLKKRPFEWPVEDPFKLSVGPETPDPASALAGGTQGGSREAADVEAADGDAAPRGRATPPRNASHRRRRAFHPLGRSRHRLHHPSDRAGLAGRSLDRLQAVLRRRTAARAFRSGGADSGRTSRLAPCAALLPAARAYRVHRCERRDGSGRGPDRHPGAALPQQGGRGPSSRHQPGQPTSDLRRDHRPVRLSEDLPIRSGWRTARARQPRRVCRRGRFRCGFGGSGAQAPRRPVAAAEIRRRRHGTRRHRAHSVNPAGHS